MVSFTILTDLSKDAELSSKSCCVKSERKTSPQYFEKTVIRRCRSARGKREGITRDREALCRRETKYRKFELYNCKQIELRMSNVDYCVTQVR